MIIFLTGLDKWQFFTFLVTKRTTVYPLVKPFIVTSLLNQNTDTEFEANEQRTIRVKLASVPTHIHKTQLLGDFANELDRLRKDLTSSLCMSILSKRFIILFRLDSICNDWFTSMPIHQIIPTYQARETSPIKMWKWSMWLILTGVNSHKNQITIPIPNGKRKKNLHCSFYGVISVRL